MPAESDDPVPVGDPAPTVADPAANAPGFARLTRDSAVYALGTLSGKALGLLLLPVLARVLSRSDYGVLDVLWSLGTGLAGILVLGLDAAVVRLYFDQSVRDRASLLGTWRVAVFGTAIAAGVGLVVAAPRISGWINGPGADIGPALLLALVVPATLLNYFCVTILRTTGRPGAYAIVTVTTFAAYGTAVICLALVGRASVASTMTAWGVSLAATSLLGLWLLRGTDLGRATREAGARLVRYGLPLAPVLAVTLASDFVQRAILLSTAGATEVAQLTVALRFGSVLTLAVAAFQLAWQPRVFAMGTSSLAYRRIAVDARRFLTLAAAASLALTAVLPFVVPIVAGGAYSVAVPTTGWCVAAALLGGVFAIAITGTTIAKRPGDVTRATTLGIVAAVAVNVLLARPFGSVGTGVALAVGQGVAAVTAITNARRAVVLPGPWLTTAVSIAAAAATAIVWTRTDVPTGLRVGALALGALSLLLDETFRESVGLAVARIRR